MNSNDQSPRVPLWVYFTTDFALLATAWWVASKSPQPLTSTAMILVVACVITGALVALVPMVIRLERQKNEKLDERQQALEALAATVSASAEQVGIATAGLNEISELVQKNLRHADQLPHRLQDKIAEFQAQLANASDTEREELERELAALRTSESERLEAISDKIARATAELAKLEAATQHHLAAAAEALGKLNLGTASAIGKAQAAAEQALAQARIEAARHVGEQAGAGVRALESARGAAIAELESRLTAATPRLIEQFQAQLAPLLEAWATSLEQKLHATLAATPPLGNHPAAVQPGSPPAAPGGTARAAADAPPVIGAPAAAPSSPETAPRLEQPATAAASAIPHAATGAETHATAAAETSARRPRRARREEPAGEPTSTNGGASHAAPEPSSSTAADPGAVASTPAAPVATPDRAAQAAALPPARPAAVPAAPESETTEREPSHGRDTAARPATPSPEASATEPPPAVPTARRRAPKPAAPPEPTLQLGLDDGEPMSGVIERVLSSDGATRLLVTAYIGIGNRLFIRGDGPGLNWDKGVPLQFVSIGKWRWETNDATGPVQFKLLKNDELECTALGTQLLDPGHQQEVMATF